MTYYAVKTTYRAKECNKNFRGETQVYHTGRGGYPIYNLRACRTDGWKRRHFAEQYIKKAKEWDKNQPMWDIEYEVIEL